MTDILEMIKWMVKGFTTLKRIKNIYMRYSNKINAFRLLVVERNLRM